MVIGLGMEAPESEAWILEEMPVQDLEKIEAELWGGIVWLS